ncbi:substrate-binding domain-containing protein [Geobacter pelophilus]|uniref:Substrate-binding domain-containing protein n=1 Tax=Geoanaerobacter pelophilus TaxID=60036 RepID=A0AAW4LAF3_9BACT|nr:substrate-binding domain-containing protein [Geoanaerobacter pelophilus]MBT0664166.1 substrate-binding domain-containing protein [Geoanaerobacter pelophilus]
MRSLLLAVLLTIAFVSLAFATGQGKSLNYGGAGQGRVIFDGRVHAAKGYVCKDCHSSLFETRKQAKITMDDHAGSGKCFGCHNGKTALADCAACHRKEAEKTVVKLHGAASVVDSLVNPHKKTVEKNTGYVLDVVKSNAGKGLIDLADGKCDASMASASVDTVVQAAKGAGREVDGSKLQLHVIAKDEVVFVVNPANKVQKLSLQQVKEIHTGKIVNWKEVGGDDLAITVVTDTLASATRGLIKQSVMKNEEYRADTLPVNVAQISDEVAKVPGAIGGLGAGFVKPELVRKLDTGSKVERPLGLITLGPPSAKVAKVIEAYKAALKQ